MKYTINGKDYTEFDINKRCAELMGVYLMIMNTAIGKQVRYMDNGHGGYRLYDPCNNALEGWPIIEKCWGELMIVHVTNNYYANWDLIMDDYKCTKLVAACICFIEINEVQHDSTI
jgi:hypothetical protein